MFALPADRRCLTGPGKLRHELYIDNGDREQKEELLTYYLERRGQWKAPMALSSISNVLKEGAPVDPKVAGSNPAPASDRIPRHRLGIEERAA